MAQNATSRPADWPSADTTDLRAHDAPHASSSIEWWYLNGHVTTEDGRDFSLFAAFFRAKRDGGGSADGRPFHFLTWALVDVASKKYHYDVRHDPRAPADALRELDRRPAGDEPRVRRALREVFAKGNLPLPDRLLTREAAVSLDRLALDYGGNRLESRADGSYLLILSDERRGIGCELVFVPEKPLVRHGHDGVVSAGTKHEMFYYFTPRCRTTGTVRLANVALPVKSGTGWYDHEFGRHETTDGASGDLAWVWLAAQLDNGWDLSAYFIFDRAKDDAVLDGRAILIAPDGSRHEHAELVFRPTETWTSTRTFEKYPCRWRLEVPAAGVALDVAAEFAAQELVTLVAPPAFWEGRVRVKGTMGRASVSGLGFVERTGFGELKNLESFLGAVGAETRSALAARLPVAPNQAQIGSLVGVKSHPEYLDGFDVAQYTRTVLEPIHLVADRGGKAWRSFGVLASFDCVGGDAEGFRHLLALPELMHVGSLIVDDVQDRSDVRRGGPACHKVYGDALAINAGNAAYFLAQLPLAGSRSYSAETMVRVYEAYFEAMRAAHAGQALDIDGVHAMMPEAVARGGDLLERRVLAAHRLKSAVPPAALARMAAELGGGTATQAEALAGLFEAFGVAFQIVDDVLNLRGFAKDLKTRGEDITHGKVTAPVAKAMSLLPLAKRRALWETIRSKPTDPEVVGQVVEQLDACGALASCEQQAAELIEAAWLRVDPLVPDSHAKVKLRAFGWFILDRHY